jgi:hypothetical protein
METIKVTKLNTIKTFQPWFQATAQVKLKFKINHEIEHTELSFKVGN